MTDLDFDNHVAVMSEIVVEPDLCGRRLRRRGIVIASADRGDISPARPQ